MKKKNMKEKFSNFMEEHKVGVAFVTGTITAVAGCMIASKVINKDALVLDPGLTELIKDAESKAVSFYGTSNNAGYTLDEIGKLGENMKTLNVQPDTKVTHAILYTDKMV